MDAAPAPLPTNLWDALPPEAQTLIVGLQAEVGTLQERIRALEARVGQDSSKSSRPPSSDPPHAARRRAATPTGHKRGGQLGHPGHFRSLLPTEQVDAVVAVAPERCSHCQQPLPSAKPCRPSRPWRHQVVELLPLAVRVTEYQMEVRRCPTCGRRTRADLPAGVPQRRFGLRLTAVVALLTGRYRLSRREVQRVLVDLWDIKLSLGGVQPVSSRAAGIVLGASAARFPGAGRPRWCGRANRALGVGGNRAPVCAVAPIPRR